MKRWHILILVVVALAIAGGGYWYFGRAATVAVVAVTRGDAGEVVYATGVVEPRHWAQVTPLVRERIVEECDCEGETVEAGHVLARLNDEQAQAALAELRARLRLAEDEYRRLTELSGAAAANQQELDRGRSEVEQLEALVTEQEARLGDYVVRAPIGGVVLRDDADVGDVADPGVALFWVGRARPLVVIADVNEEDIPRVAVGQDTLVASDAFPARNFEAVVDNITPKGDPVNKTYRVRLRLPDDTPLMIGMTVDTNMITRISEDTLLVPSLAVQDGRVFVVEDGVARRREIEVGIRGMQSIEVLSGLAEGDRVISPYPEELDDGARVRVAQE